MRSSSDPLADFLRDRRESLRPESVGVQTIDRRRVRGLRRTEVAERAGISADYYLRLEQGRGHQPSEQVLRGLCRALMLDIHGSAHLERLARLGSGSPSPAAGDDVPDGVIKLLAARPDAPAYLSNAAGDIVAVNASAHLLAPESLAPGVNLVTSIFLHYPDPHSEPHWRRAATNAVAALRYHADPRSPRLRELVAELSASDPRFLPIWNRCEVRPLTSSRPLFLVEPHGWVTLRAEPFAVSGASGYTLTHFFAEPGTPGAVALQDLTDRVRGVGTMVAPLLAVAAGVGQSAGALSSLDERNRR
ncbi:helix-turn-helix transcriptional regulator [Microbacterium flavum]|uniref:Helix-turn-helix domain-containing protein n=1 Tax=Microbacterium flavum TaxID=415216 RepID=A0ABS5XU45_9MICO|nr:helix-turn-helix transcriptional regulator [Microbacterium flavum]MBT8798049.1 helix-turn-helix domain-containing protein [Microbacterium flavum]